MLKANKTSKPAVRTAANTLKDEGKRTKKSTLADKSGDKKPLTRRSDPLVKAVGLKSTTLIKTKSSSTVLGKPLPKKNVMNTIHNVTVASPPSSAGKERSASTSDIVDDVRALNHSRSRTRTIKKEDSFLHQQQLVEAAQAKPTAPVKEPVAFEIKFEEPTKPVKDEEDYNYESDFESYESDFEPEVPSTSASAEKLDESTDDEVAELESTDKTINVAKYDKERVDSGSFEMSTSRKAATPSSVHYDSIEDTINSHDSGISYEELNVPSKQATSQKVLDFYKRGEELMKKITLDVLSFSIFESKPIPYETFMSLYGGQINTFQVSTQSESLMAADEVQTDPIVKAEAWTQFPAKFTRSGLEVINSKLYNEEKLGVGEGNVEPVKMFSDESEQMTSYLQAINNFSKSEIEHIGSKKTNSSLDSFALQKFIENAAFTISNVIDNQAKHQELKPSKIPICRGFMNLKFSENEFLRDTAVRKLYTNSKISNVIVTVHKRPSSQQNLLCLWDVLNNKRPRKMFSSWSDVECIEIHPQERDVIVGGCNDGTISLWDVQEFVEWRDEDQAAMLVRPCEIISLNQENNNFALDNVVALRSLPQREHKSSSTLSHSQTSQICSLHRNGSIIIWTITRLESELVNNSELDYTHIKSRVKLMKNNVIDLIGPSKIAEGKNITRKSAFEKTRYYFENDLFNDKVLRELQEIDSTRLTKAKAPIDDELTKFNDCAVNLHEIYVATDLNYISAVARLNLGDETRKIFTNESAFISPTVIAVHPINSNVLAVGQANGELKFMKVLHDSDQLSLSSLKTGRKSTDASTINDILSKSCAFQNIVEKDKKLYDETQALNNLESDELKAFLVNEALSEQLEHELIREKLKVPFDRNIFNSFEVSPGSVNVVSFNKTGEFLFVVVGKQLKIFNCWLSTELDHQEKINVCDLKCVQGADSFEYLILLTTDNEILVNKLKR